MADEGTRNPALLVGIGAGALGTGALARQLANVAKTKGGIQAASKAARLARGQAPVTLAAQEMQAVRAGMASQIPFRARAAELARPVLGQVRGELGPAFSTGPQALNAAPTPIRMGPIGSTASPSAMGITGAGPAIPIGPNTPFYPGAYSPQQISNIQALGAQTQAEINAAQNMGSIRSMAYRPVAPVASGGIPVMPAQALQAEQAVAADPIAAFLSEEGARRGGTAAVGEGAGLLSRLGYAPAGTTGMSRFIAQGLTPRAALSRVGAGALVGQLGASMVVDPLNIGGKNSALDRFSTGATFGAGLGAGIGNVIPIPGVGAGIGAATGALLGGTGNVIKGWFDDQGMNDVSKKNQQRYLGLADLMDTAGLTAQQKATLKAQYETGLKLVGDDTSAQSDLLGRMEQSIMGLAGTNPYSLTGQDLIGLQTEIAKYMQPLQERMTSSNAGVTAAYNQIASQMSNPQLADSARLMGAQAQANADNMNLAIARAATMAPMNYAYTLDKTQPQSSSGGTDLASLLGTGG